MKMIGIAEFRQRVAAGKRPKIGVRFAPAQQDVTVDKTAERVVSFVFSDGSVDRYGDTIDARGWVLDKFKANPVALFGHDSGTIKNVIGKAINVRVEGNRLIGDIQFIEPSVNPDAETVFQMVRQGFLKAVSVGFNPIEWTQTKDKSRPGGIDFLKQELLEISIVPIPANPNALQLAKAAGLDVDRLGLRATPAVMTKGMYDVSCLARLLAELGYLQDSAAWEAEYEGDASEIPGRLAGAMNELGQILVDMTAEEVGELLAGRADEEPIILLDDPLAAGIELSPAQKAFHSLSNLARQAAIGAQRRFVIQTDQLLSPENVARMRAKMAAWVRGSEKALFVDKGVTVTVIDPPALSNPWAARARVNGPNIEIDARAGKVLSGINEKALRDTCDHMTKAMDHVNGVLSAASPIEGDDDEDKAAAERGRRARALTLSAGF